MRDLDFSNYKQTKIHEERVAYAKEVVEELKQNRTILIDILERETCMVCHPYYKPPHGYDIIRK